MLSFCWCGLLLCLVGGVVGCCLWGCGGGGLGCGGVGGVVGRREHGRNRPR